MNLNTIEKEYKRVKNLIFHLVSRSVPQMDVDDIVQDVYVRTLTHNDSIENPGAFMVRVAQNLSMDYLKSARHRLSVCLEDTQDWGYEDDEDTTLKSVITDREFERLCEIISTLPEQSRKAFILKRVYGYSQREIAQEMGLSESTVEKHLAAGLKRCRHALTTDEVATKRPSSGRQK